jgi:hypothetical protein
MHSRDTGSQGSDMNATAMAQDGPKNKESRIDDLDAALEESEEQNEENRVVEEADANQNEPSND